MKLRIMALLSMTALGVLTSSSAAPGPAERESTAVVIAGIAEFEIPVADQGTWRWARTTTPDDAREFSWEIGVKSRGEYYKFGFSLFKRPGSQERMGGLEDLLKAGQASLWRLEPLDSRATVVPGANVSVSEGNQHVVVRIADAALVEMLFADHPTTVRFQTKTPDATAESYEVSISYRD